MNIRVKRNLVPYNFKDHLKLKDMSSVQLSPDGSRVVCVITTPDLKKNNRRDEILLFNIATKQTQFISEGNSPMWAPDGSKIAFLKEKGEKQGIWLYHFNDNSEKFLVPVYQSAYFINHLEDRSFKWSPSGKHIAYVSTDKPNEEKNAEVMATTRLLYKSKGGKGRDFYTNNALNTHIWTIDSESGIPKQITSGSYDEHSLCWSPDGHQISFISNRTPDPDNNQHCDLWKVDIHTKEIKRITQTCGTTFQPRWSPCGKFIAYLSTSGEINTNDSMSDDTQIYITSSEGTEHTCITKHFDRRIENISWHPQGQKIFFTAGNHGQTPLWLLTVKTGTVSNILGGNCHILEYSASNSGQEIAFLKTDIASPPELFLYKWEEQNSCKLSEVNNELIQKCSFQDANEFWVTSFDDIKIQGWIIKPVNYTEKNNYPLVLLIHGGPHNMFGYDFEERAQLLAACGYGVLFINPRGSSGYGQQFSNGNLLNWGGGDYKDLMAGVDYVLENYKWVDGKNLGVTGQSYGGYMANWIITQTNRFKAAVVDGGISNLISFFGTSIYHSLIESEFNGSAYDNFELLWQWSPLKNIRNAKTPTLFLHGKKDNEVPASQAEEMYVALKKQGIETMLALYLNEGHGWRPNLSPKNRIDLNEKMVNWFNKHLKN